MRFSVLSSQRLDILPDKIAISEKGIEDKDNGCFNGILVIARFIFILVEVKF